MASTSEATGAMPSASTRSSGASVDQCESGTWWCEHAPCRPLARGKRPSNPFEPAPLLDLFGDGSELR